MMDDLTLVVPQQRLGNVTWRILAGWEEMPGIGRGLMTAADWRSDGRREAAGFDGRPLREGRIINAWRGSSTGLPDFLLLRAHADVSSVVAVEISGNERLIPFTARSAWIRLDDDRRLGATWP